MNPEPGEVWLADLGLAAKTRPHRDRFETGSRASESARALCAADNSVPWQPVRGADSPAPLFASRLVRQHTGNGFLTYGQAKRKLGRVSDQTVDEIRTALIYALDLDAKLR